MWASKDLMFSLDVFCQSDGILIMGFGVWGSWVPLRKNLADIPIHHTAGLLRKREGKRAASIDTEDSPKR